MYRFIERHPWLDFLAHAVVGVVLIIAFVIASAVSAAIAREEDCDV